MISRTRCLLAVFAICLAFGQARGQEGQPGARPPGAPGTTGPENKYVEMSHSTDRVLKATAERYLNLVKFQEWGGATGKTQMAKYVSHDPDLKRVKLSVARGTGKDRVVKEFDVEVEKLNKTCQSRVKQIDVLQKRLDELATAAAAKGDGTGRPGGPEGPGAPTTRERVAQPQAGQGPEGAYAGPGGPPPGPGTPPQAAAPEVDPSASDPDPLGFAELPAVVAAPPGPGNAPIAAPPATQPEIPANPASFAPGPTKAWQTDYDAFLGQFKVYPVGPGQPLPPTDRLLFRVYEGSAQQRTAEWDVDFGELNDLRPLAEVMDIAMGNRPPSLTKADIDQKIKNAKEAATRIGEVTWEATFRKFNGAEQPIELIKSPLPKPLDILFTLDPQAAGSTPEQWSALTRGDRIRFKGRLSMSNPSLIRVYVREPVKIGVSP